MTLTEEGVAGGFEAVGGVGDGVGGVFSVGDEKEYLYLFEGGALDLVQEQLGGWTFLARNGNISQGSQPGWPCKTFCQVCAASKFICSECACAQVQRERCLLKTAISLARFL